MKTLEYTVRFTTPAFLGNADQSGQWRTPPFKALLRQWWRVAYAADRQFKVNVAEMRHDEGRLFGHAWLESDRDDEGRQVAARKSLVRMRLDRWDGGSLKKAQWPSDSSVTHPEVKNRKGETVPVGSALYFGYGPLTYDSQRRATTLKANAAIQSDEVATFAVAIPTTHSDPALQRLLDANPPRIEQALWLMDRYGTLGGRSRNGWGSFALLPLPPGEGWGEGVLPLRPYRDCLNLDWPHAIGQDDRGRSLIWQTNPFDNWKALMRELAIVKIGLRRQFVFTTGRNASNPEARHWLSYPVTNHNVASWKERGRGDFRLPNSLRFKVRALPDGKLAGVVFHVPCSPPRDFNPYPTAIQDVWQRVHAFLDNPAQKLTRIPA